MNDILLIIGDVFLGGIFLLLLAGWWRENKGRYQARWVNWRAERKNKDGGNHA